ncbi:hypothetical protein EG328_011084 [Venturia inaequalis]|uniref:Uncharacterized protein n=1 Tax=Venturia inaequalis TaxID=5025 RepID=A0A8H3V320_VENIN|nr:hypothetical protein EG328_011084 [Venturia inaequalis]
MTRLACFQICIINSAMSVAPCAILAQFWFFYVAIKEEGGERPMLDTKSEFEDNAVKTTKTTESAEMIRSSVMCRMKTRIQMWQGERKSHHWDKRSYRGPLSILNSSLPNGGNTLYSIFLEYVKFVKEKMCCVIFLYY